MFFPSCHVIRETVNTDLLSQDRAHRALSIPPHWFCSNGWLAVDCVLHFISTSECSLFPRCVHSLCLPFLPCPHFLPSPPPAVPSSMRPATPPSRCHWWIQPCRHLWAWLWTGSNTTCTGPTPETNPSLWPPWTAPRDASSSTPTSVSPEPWPWTPTMGKKDNNNKYLETGLMNESLTPFYNSQY